MDGWASDHGGSLELRLTVWRIKASKGCIRITWGNGKCIVFRIVNEFKNRNLSDCRRGVVSEGDHVEIRSPEDAQVEIKVETCSAIRLTLEIKKLFLGRLLLLKIRVSVISLKLSSGYRNELEFFGCDAWFGVYKLFKFP